jgi:protein-disulfide isomerase
MKRYLPFVIIGVVLLLALGAVAMMFRSAQPAEQPAANSSANTAATPMPGAPRGVVAIEEYGDYQCPPCGALHPEMKKIKQEFGDRIRFVFYQFPLTQIHRNAAEAARAAIAARQQGKFWEMHDLLYATQKEWSELPTVGPIAAGFANQLRLDVGRFVRDMDSPQVAAQVVNDVRRGESLGVNSTPTLFINGQKVMDEDMTPEKLRRIISERLAGK